MQTRTGTGILDPSESRASITGGDPPAMPAPYLPVADPDWVVRCGDLRVAVDRASLDRRYADWGFSGYRDRDGLSSPWPVEEVIRVSEPGHPGLHLMGLLTDGDALLSLEVREAGSDRWQPAPFAVAHHVVWVAHVPSRTTRLHLTTTAGEKSRTWASLQAVG